MPNMYILYTTVYALREIKGSGVDERFVTRASV